MPFHVSHIGSVPTEISYLSKMVELRLNDNSFTGKVYCLLKIFECAFYIGPLPDVRNATNLLNYILNTNSLTGTYISLCISNIFTC